MTDWKALCAELLDELQYQTDWSVDEELQERARAALAAEPQGEAGTVGKRKTKAEPVMSIITVFLIGGPGDGMVRGMRGWQLFALPREFILPLQEPPPRYKLPEEDLNQYITQTTVYDRCDHIRGVRGEVVYRWRGDK